MRRLPIPTRRPTIGRARVSTKRTRWISAFVFNDGVREVGAGLAGDGISVAGEIDAENAFADGFPILVSSTASIEELNRQLGLAGATAQAL